MGLIRKVTSVSTLGLVDFRSDKERTAAYTKGARKEARKQTALMQAQLQQQHAQPAAFPPPPPAQGASTVPPGWYPSPDPAQAASLQWWDGSTWTPQFQPMQRS